MRSRTCVRCIMDGSDPAIVFDDTGVCNHCLGFDRRRRLEIPAPEARDAILARVVDQIKSAARASEADCVIGVSGGVDSTMVALLVRRLGLRPVAVHLDNGWNSELAVDNIKNALRKLDIDLITHVIDWEEFRDIQLAFLKASVPNCELPTDHAINALLYNTAQRLGIRHIISGGNLMTEGILPLSWGYYNHDLRYLRSVHGRYGTVPIKTLPTLSLRRFGYLVLARRIRMVPLLNLIEYNKAETIEVLKAELDWRPYDAKHYESIYTRFFQGYILPEKFGYDKRRAHLSSLVCAGQLSREAALEEMEGPPYDKKLLAVDRAFVLKKLGLSEAQFSEIMAARPRTYRDFKSSAWILARRPGLRSFFKARATGSLTGLIDDT